MTITSDAPAPTTFQLASTSRPRQVSLGDVLDFSMQYYGSRPCWIQTREHGMTSVTYADAMGLLCQHAQNLHQGLLPFGNTDVTVAYLCNNSLDYALSILAAAQTIAASNNETAEIGHCCPALLNTRWSIPDMLAALQPARNILIVYGPEWYDTAEKLYAQLLQGQDQSSNSSCAIIRIMILPSFGQEALEWNVEHHRQASKEEQCYTGSMVDFMSHYRGISNLSSHDAVLVFTSGTTAAAKGVRLSHRALWMQAAAKLAPPCLYAPQTCMLSSTVPFFHVGGLSSLLAVWMAGGSLVEMISSGNLTKINKGFDANNVWDSIRHSIYPCNTLVLVPAMVHAIQQVYDPLFGTLEHVNLVLVGGQSLSCSQQDFLRTTFPSARIVQTFACSEAASSLTFWDVTNPISVTEPQRDAPPGVCVGIPPSHIQLRLFPICKTSIAHGMERDKRSDIIEAYKVGLIGTRGPHVMNGYWGKDYPRYTPNDWYITSDYGFWDSRGRLYFCGRETDTIRTGGETVWATEVEGVLQRHGSVSDVAVLGLTDDRFGETVGCAIVPRDPSACYSLKLADLRRWCTAQGLARYKQPRRLVLLSSLPRNNSGKILKHLLRDCFEHSLNSSL